MGSILAVVSFVALLGMLVLVHKKAFNSLVVAEDCMVGRNMMVCSSLDKGNLKGFAIVELMGQAEKLKVAYKNKNFQNYMLA